MKLFRGRIMYISMKLNKLRLSVISAVIAAAAALCIIVPAFSESEASPAPVLHTIMYHGFTKNSAKQNSYMIDPSCLEDDLIYLFFSTLDFHGYGTIIFILNPSCCPYTLSCILCPVTEAHTLYNTKKLDSFSYNITHSISIPQQ